MSFDFGINTIDNVLCLSLNIKNKKIIYVGRDGNGMTPSRPAIKILSHPALSCPENFWDGISRPKMIGNGTDPVVTGFFAHPYPYISFIKGQYINMIGLTTLLSRKPPLDSYLIQLK